MSLYIIWLLMFLLILALVIWWFASMSHYSSVLLTPGQHYISDGRKYVYPNVDSYGPSYLLKDEYIVAIRTLVSRVNDIFAELNIMWWITGGTLLAYHMYHTIPMPFDDDADVAVEEEHKPFLFSQAFCDVALKYGVSVIYLRGASSQSANRTGACVRCQLANSTATLDIFFWKHVRELGKVIKLDGWSPAAGDIYNNKEQFLFEDVFPIQQQLKFDNLIINVPRNPFALLTTQYGPKVCEKSIARSLFISHFAPFALLNLMWTTKAPG